MQSYVPVISSRGKALMPTSNRKANRLIEKGRAIRPPSTRARWGWKLRLCGWLARYYPISLFMVKDVAAVTKSGKRRWNANFSPLEVGKA